MCIVDYVVTQELVVVDGCESYICIMLSCAIARFGHYQFCASVYFDKIKFETACWT